MIDVCCAIIMNDDEVLAVQRGPETDHPYQWEFPGGKIKSNETAEEAIRREIMEELSVEIEIVKKIESVEHDYGQKQIRLIPFVCRIINGSIFLTEHIAMQWLSKYQTETLDWSEADRKLIESNHSGFRKK